MPFFEPLLRSEPLSLFLPVFLTRVRSGAAPSLNSGTFPLRVSSDSFEIQPDFLVLLGPGLNLKSSSDSKGPDLIGIDSPANVESRRRARNERSGRGSGSKIVGGEGGPRRLRLRSGVAFPTPSFVESVPGRVNTMHF